RERERAADGEPAGAVGGRGPEGAGSLRRVRLDEEAAPRRTVARRPVVLTGAGREPDLAAGGVAVVDEQRGPPRRLLLVPVREDLVVLPDVPDAAGDDEAEGHGPAGVDRRDDLRQLVLAGPAA